MHKTPLEALKELVRLKRIKESGDHYTLEQQRAAWGSAFEIVDKDKEDSNERFMKLRQGLLYTDKHGNPVHDLVHRTTPKTGDE